MKQIKQYIAVAVAALAMPSMAQAFDAIDFESTDSYKDVDVYDCWESSPFRTGELKGNVAICANPDTDVNEFLGYAPNTSANVLGAQRSRFAGNRFGVRVDLNDTFELTTSTQYVHMMVYSPVASRVMLVGLGSRTDRPSQNPYTEQFWELSINGIEANRWTDMVFAIKGAGGIDIRSLVLVPDCESPHNLTSDFIFYIDNIDITSSNVPRLVYDYYIVNYNKTSTLSRTDRYTSNVLLKGSADGDQTISVGQQNDQLLYHDLTEKHFTAKPGETLTPSVDFNGSWMNGYLYIDYNNDGKFEPLFTASNTPADGGELVAYSFCPYDEDDAMSGTNSKGTVLTGSSRASAVMPSFTLPADLQPGAYRMRFKTDWACSDPAGNTSSTNDIITNGGMIADVMLYVHTDNVTVNDYQLNGEVLTSTGEKLNNYSATHGANFTVQIAPEKGFEQDGLTVYYGYNLGNDQKDKYGNPQWSSYTMSSSEFNSNGIGTIPGAYMVGANVRIEGNNKEAGTATVVTYPLNFDEGLTYSRTDRHLNSITLTSSLGSTTVSTDSSLPYKVYTKALDSVVSAKAGDTVTGTINFTGWAMHGYLYIDWDNDGQFDASINSDGTPADGSDVASYSFYQQKNSLGESFTVAGGGDSSFWSVLPKFTVPEQQNGGDYYARFIMDWNALYPGGQYGFGSNNIDSNGGAVLDFTFKVENDASGITDISTDNNDTDGWAYDLCGRRVNLDKAAKGIYIVNGKKIIIK